MEQNTWAIECEEWIIWNSALGVRDFVTIGRIDADQDNAWLEEPYGMVGPFSLNELETNGLIRFAACVVMSKQRWQKDRQSLLMESSLKRRQEHEAFIDALEEYNRRKKNTIDSIDQEFRYLLDLPPEGILKSSQIKSAYRKAAKKAHPDTGGSHEIFVRLKEAYDALLKSL